MKIHRLIIGIVFIAAGIVSAARTATAEPGATEKPSGPGNVYAPLPVFDALSAAEWRRVDAGVNRGLAWLAKQQQADGSFPTHIGGQPAVTSFATMAFLSRGHRPGAGPYGKVLERAIDYALRCQRQDGLLLLDTTDRPVEMWNYGAHTAFYNHAITGLMLCEVYGTTDIKREEKIRATVTSALELARKMQRRPSAHPLDAYGWRYYRQMDNPGCGGADLSVTGWFVMFYRSARNAEFEVPEEYVTDALQFVRRSYDEESGAFYYGLYSFDHHIGRGMTGDGLLCMTLLGQRDDQLARKAGQWILQHPFTRYNDGVGSRDRFHYGAYYCSQAMFVLGGEYWRQFYPTMAETMLDNQRPAGNWDAEAGNDAVFGNVYTTALTVLSLTPPYQLLPIYQR